MGRRRVQWGAHAILPPARGRPVSFSAALLLGGAVQVAVAAAFAGASASAYRGVPSGLGLLFSVISGLLAGPLAGVLVALAGGVGFVVFVTNGQLGGWVAVVLWIVAAGIAGAVADRYREAGHDRDIAHASERRARQAAESESTRLAHLHALAGRLADAVTVADVCGALVDTAIGSLARRPRRSPCCRRRAPGSRPWRRAATRTRSASDGRASPPTRRTSSATRSPNARS